jgi:hypothetical protein
MTKEAIKGILLTHPENKRFTTKCLVNLLRLQGYSLLASDVTSACLELIEENEISLCHIFENGKWKYVRSSNKYIKLKHNRHLISNQRKKESRKYLVI